MFNQSDIIVLGQPKALLPILCVRIREVVAPIPPYGWLIITEENNYAVVQQRSEMIVQTTFVTDLQSLNALTWYSRAVATHPYIRSLSPQQQAEIYKKHLQLQELFA